MSDFSELKSMFSDFPENLTKEELQYLEHLRYNLSKKYEPVSVSTGILTILIILYGSISLIAVIGNALVIFVVLYKRNMQTVTNVFIANLALADVALGLFTIPFQFHAAIMQRWVVADFMCKVAPFVKNLSVNVSILTLTVIAFDRYVAVMYPLKAGFRKQVAFIVLFVIWVLSISSSVPDLLYYKVNIIFDIEIWAKKPFCDVQWPSDAFPKFYFSYFLLLQYVVPLTIISFSYIRVAYRIWGSKAPGYEIQKRDHIRSVHKKKVVKMLIIVVSLFAFCWLPLQLYNFISAVYPIINEYQHINIVWFCSNWLAMSNSCYNPFIYGLLNEKFKREFKNLCRLCTCCGRKRKYVSYFFYETSEDINHKTSILFNGSDSSNAFRNSRKRKRSNGFTKPYIQSTKI